MSTYKIIEKEHFSENVVKLEVEAPLIARSRRPGHFVIVRTGNGGERIPLTIADADLKKGSITLVVQAVGESTRKICALERHCRATWTSHTYREGRNRGLLRRRSGRCAAAPNCKSDERSRQSCGVNSGGKDF